MTGKVFENNARINTFRNLTDKHIRISLPRLSIKLIFVPLEKLQKPGFMKSPKMTQKFIEKRHLHFCMAGFFYNSRDFIANPSDFSLSLAGNVPILIERINGELRVLGPRYQERLKQIESELPSACLHMKPEQPYW